MFPAFLLEFACLGLFRKFQWRDKAALGKFPSYIRNCASSGVGTRLIDFRVWGGEELESEDDEEETENNSRQEEAGRVGGVGIYLGVTRGASIVWWGVRESLWRCR
jgi:hypothetical protein